MAVGRNLLQDSHRNFSLSLQAEALAFLVAGAVFFLTGVGEISFMESSLSVNSMPVTCCFQVTVFEAASSVDGW